MIGTQYSNFCIKSDLNIKKIAKFPIIVTFLDSNSLKNHYISTLKKSLKNHNYEQVPD